MAKFRITYCWTPEPEFVHDVAVIEAESADSAMEVFWDSPDAWHDNVEIFDVDNMED